MYRSAVLLACSVTLWACVAGESRVGTADPDRANPEKTLERFTAALVAEHWSDAYAMLSGRWRSRYTPTRLAADFAAAGSIARDAADRVRALLAAHQPLVFADRTARLIVGEGKAAVLLEEEGVWRVDALE